MTVPMVDLKPEVLDWVQSRPIHKLGGSEARFLSLFRLGVRDFLSRSPLKLNTYTPLSNEQFVGDPKYWATSGASDNKHLKVELDGKVVNAQHTKWATALSVTKDELLGMITSWDKQRNHIIQKRELGKVRPVVASDFVTNLKMARVGYWLEAALDGHKNSTLFMSARQQLTLWQQMVTDSMNHC